jgi:putative DNA primase/helicase
MTNYIGGDIIGQFRDAMRAAGLPSPDTIIADGDIHRFAITQKRGDDSGWYVLHPNPTIPAGSFGNWRTGAKYKWHAKVGRKLSSVEVTELTRRAIDDQRQREADEANRYTEARELAMAIWSAAQPADVMHAYLVAKRVQPHGIKQGGNNLIIPVCDASGELHSLQFIPADGKAKRFLIGGRKKGCYFGIGKPDRIMCVAEGYATAASVYEATGHAVAVAFDAGNLEAVAVALRAKLPNIRIIFCADDDYRTDGSPGMREALKAARAVNGLVAVPNFGDHRPDGATDFNDLDRYWGTDAVKHAIANAQAPEVAAGQPEAPNATAAGSSAGVAQ